MRWRWVIGLDMYLTRKTYVKNWDHMDHDQKHEIVIKKGGKVRRDIDPKKITYIEEEAGYWRKANAIHEWFVTNCQEGEDDCRQSYVSEENLRELLDTVNKVLEDHKLADDLLPTASGFFFGSTDYDEYYYSDLKDTKKMLEEALEKGGEYYYSSSW